MKSATQSGVMYSRGSPISYTSCSLTPATVTRPPVPGCFVISKLPSGDASTIGYPTLARSGMRSQSMRQLPPLHCAPHSIVCPATVPAASRSHASARHPKACIKGPRVSPVSVTRPVITIPAPRRSASTTGPAPRYAFADCTRSRTSSRGRPVSRFFKPWPRASSSSSRPSRSSPLTTPIVSFPARPSARAAAATASAQARGFTPPAFVVTLMLRSATIGRIRSISGTKSLA